jgi:hypothetical protein
VALVGMPLFFEPIPDSFWARTGTDKNRRRWNAGFDLANFVRYRLTTKECGVEHFFRG